MRSVFLLSMFSIAAGCGHATGTANPVAPPMLVPETNGANVTAATDSAKTQLQTGHWTFMYPQGQASMFQPTESNALGQPGQESSEEDWFPRPAMNLTDVAAHAVKVTVQIIEESCQQANARFDGTDIERIYIGPTLLANSTTTEIPFNGLITTQFLTVIKAVSGECLTTYFYDDPASTAQLDFSEDGAPGKAARSMLKTLTLKKGI